MSKRVQARISLPADAAKVWAMLTSADYLAAKAATALSHEVQVQETADGTVIRLTSVLDLTNAAQGQDGRVKAALNVIGPKLTVVEETVWQPATADGMRTGQLTITLPGVPLRVEVTGTVQLSPTTDGSEFRADLTATASVPMLGQTIENFLEHHVGSVIAHEERIAKTWLSTH